MSVTSRIAVVTGAGSGIGRAAAVALQGEGWHVVLAGRRKEELGKTAAMAKAGGGRMLAVAADVGRAADVKALFMADRFLKIDFMSFLREAEPTVDTMLRPA